MNPRLLALSLSDALSPRVLLALRELAGSWETIWDIPEKNLTAFTRRFRNKDFEGKKALSEKADHVLSVSKNLNLQILTCDEPAYPRRLLELYLPPLALFIKGTLSPLALSEEKKNIAIVGTRKPGAFYVDFTRAAARALSSQGWHVISGLAQGIDGEAHAHVVKPGTTTAVLAFGHDRLYPHSHKKLFEMIVDQGGALLSEYPPGTPPLRHHFPMRNRIISGLSDLVLMVQAGEKSGALITVRYALEQNRDVLVLEGEPGNERAAGNRLLISEGATPVRSPLDIFEYYDHNKPSQDSIQERKAHLHTFNPNTEEGRLLNALVGPPKLLSEISENLHVPVEKIVSSLMPLLLSGQVAEMPGDRYYLASHAA